MKKIFLIIIILSGISIANELEDKNGNIVKNVGLSDNYFFGFQNEVDTGLNNIISGSRNKIKESYNSFVAGDENILHGLEDQESKGIIVVGYKNDITGSFNSFINGKYNILNDSQYSSVTGILNNLKKSNETQVMGHENTIEDSGYSNIYGNENKVKNRSNNSYIVGLKNEVDKGDTAYIHGSENKLKNSSCSHIEGDSNEIMNDDNTIDTTGVSTKNSNYIFGKYNKILNSGNSHIQGNSNKIEKSEGSSINGTFSTIENSENSYIQGYASKIENATNSSIIGGYFSSVNMNNSLALGAYSTTKKIKNKGYLTDQDTKYVYALAVGGEYVYKDNKGNKTVYKAKRRIQGLADGAEDDEAVTVAQLKKVQKSIQNQGAEVDKKLEGINTKSDLALSGVANSVAMANLPQVSGDRKFNLAASYGYYGGSHAVAVGFSGTNDKRNFTYKLSGSVNSKGNLAFGIGAGVMMGSVDNKDKRIEELTNEVKELRKENIDTKENIKKQNMKIQKLEEIINKLMNK